MRWFKKKDYKAYNIHHPEFSGMIEVAFTTKGRTFYRFKDDMRMPFSRYQVMQTFFVGYELRMDYNLFKAFLEEIEKDLNGTRGNVNIGRAMITIEKMKARAELAFDPEQAYNIASVVYFDDTEDLFKYDAEHNKKKIQSWKEAKMIDFFYTKPLSELLNLSSFSKTDLQNYLEEVGQLLEDLTLDTQQV